MANQFKKYFFILALLQIFTAYLPAYAQTTSYDYSQGGKNPISSQIREYLCAPSEVNSSSRDNAALGVDQNSAAFKNNNSGDLYKCINQLYKFAIILAGVIGVFFVVIAGYVYMSAEGNQESVDKAKSILTSTIASLVILMSGFLLLKAINPDLIQFKSIQPPSVKISTTTPSDTGGTPTDTGDGTTSTSCKQTFSVSSSVGCLISNNNCVDVSNYTSTHGCESNNGTCLLSTQASGRVKTFITKFNQLGSKNGCSLKISSAIQNNNGPSVSACHQNGTCVDFNLLPYNDTCRQAFYQASKDSGSVVSFLNEYESACVAPTTTGGNIHVNF